MTISFDKALGIHEQALYLHDSRQKVLAENIAHADTPGYKAKDIDFRSVLQQVGSEEASAALKKTHQRHLNTDNKSSFSYAIEERQGHQNTLDGNTVEPDREHTAFAENAVRYEATLQFLSGRFSSMKSALKGGR